MTFISAWVVRIKFLVLKVVRALEERTIYHLEQPIDGNSLVLNVENCTFVPLQLHNISVYFPIGIKYAPLRLFLLFNKHRHENAIAILMQKVCRVSFIAVCWRNKGTFTKIAWQRDSLI